MKKRIFASVLLVMMLVSLMFTMLSCGDDEIRGISIVVYDSAVNYDPDNNTTYIQISLSATNQNSTRVVERFTYNIYGYDAYGSVISVREHTFESTVYPGVTTYLNVPDYTVHGEVVRVWAAPSNMRLGGEAEGDEYDTDGPVFTDVSTWGPGAWFWVIVAAVFALGVIGNIVAAVVAFNDWDYEEAWGNVGGAVINAVIAIVILVILF